MGRRSPMPSNVKIAEPHGQRKVVWIEELDSFVEATAGDSGDVVIPDIC
jgi:hypothetical protein